MVTRADVARVAGVAPSTVSYTLNGGRPVADSTRERVLAAISDLGYTPNAVAAALAGGRSRLITMLLPTSDRTLSDSDLEYVVAATDEARGLGYELILMTTEDHDLGRMLHLHRRGLTDGVLLMDVLLEDARVPLLQGAGIKFSLIGRTSDPGLPHTDRDFEHDTRLALEYLAGLGHRHIAVVTSPESAFRRGYGAVVRPIDALKSYAEYAGLDLTVLTCEASVDSGRDALASLLTREPNASAVISLIDEATMGVYHEALARDLSIPHDLSVFSITISSQRAAFFSPGLTAISPPAEAIGRGAVRTLVNVLHPGAVDPGPQLWAGRLVVSRSTAPPRRTVT